MGQNIRKLAALLAASTAACSAPPGGERTSSTSAPLRSAGPGDSVYDVAITSIQGTTIFHGHKDTQSMPWDDDYVYLSVAGGANGNDLVYLGHYDDGVNEFGRVTSGGTVVADPTKFRVASLPMVSTDRVAISFAIDSRTSASVASVFKPAQPNEVRYMDDGAEQSALNVFFAYPLPLGPSDPFPLWYSIPDGFPQPHWPVGAKSCDGYVAKDTFLLDLAGTLGALGADGASTSFTRSYDADTIACFADQNSQDTVNGGWDFGGAHTIVTFTVTRHDLPLPIFGPPCAPRLTPQYGAPESAWLGTWRDTGYGGQSLLTATVAANPRVPGAQDTFTVHTSQSSPMCYARSTSTSASATIGTDIVSPSYTSDEYESLCFVRFAEAPHAGPGAGLGGAEEEEESRVPGIVSDNWIPIPIYASVDAIPLPRQTELTLYREACASWRGAYHVRYMRRDAYGTPIADVMLSASYAPPR